MPADGVDVKPKDEIMSFEEIARLTSVFARLGVDKVRLTGGEPTVRKGLEGLMRDISDIPGIERLLMTTNGYTLATHAQTYRDAGLNGLNISVDSLKPERFSEITRGSDLGRVLAGIERALEAGFDSIKINVVLMSGVNEDEICDFVQFAVDRKTHVRFIEFMPFVGNGWNKGGVVPYRKMKGLIEEKFELVPIETEKSAVAKEFQVGATGGSVGFVTSVTDDFCGGCNRIRLTAEGQIKTCLFLLAGTSLRDMVRNGASDDDLAVAIRTALMTKWAGHPPMERLIGLDDRAMVQIGG
jgi:cyclic pyranopterin phosphate synthase